MFGSYWRSTIKSYRTESPRCAFVLPSPPIIIKEKKKQEPSCQALDKGSFLLFSSHFLLSCFCSCLSHPVLLLMASYCSILHTRASWIWSLVSQRLHSASVYNRACADWIQLLSWFIYKLRRRWQRLSPPMNKAVGFSHCFHFSSGFISAEKNALRKKANWGHRVGRYLPCYLPWNPNTLSVTLLPSAMALARSWPPIFTTEIVAAWWSVLSCSASSGEAPTVPETIRDCCVFAITSVKARRETVNQAQRPDRHSFKDNSLCTHPFNTFTSSSPLAAFLHQTVPHPLTFIVVVSLHCCSRCWGSFCSSHTLYSLVEDSLGVIFQSFPFCFCPSSDYSSWVFFTRYQ